MDKKRQGMASGTAALLLVLPATLPASVAAGEFIDPPEAYAESDKWTSAYGPAMGASDQEKMRKATLVQNVALVAAGLDAGAAIAGTAVAIAVDSSEKKRAAKKAEPDEEQFPSGSV